MHRRRETFARPACTRPLHSQSFTSKCFIVCPAQSTAVSCVCVTASLGPVLRVASTNHHRRVVARAIDHFEAEPNARQRLRAVSHAAAEDVTVFRRRLVIMSKTFWN